MEPSDGRAYRVTFLTQSESLSIARPGKRRTYMQTVGLERVQSSEVVAGHKEGYVVLVDEDANHSIPNISSMYNGV